MSAPQYCRPEAYRLFADQMARLNESGSLLLAAIAISLHALDDVDPLAVVRQIDALGDRARARVRGASFEARLAHLHHVLFDEEGFRGNAEHYFLPTNSYLPVVLTTRRGIPISLALLYKAVAERLDIEVEGVNAPGHFLVRLPGEGGGMIVDPFVGGTVLNFEEAIRRIEQVTGHDVPRSSEFLPTATHSVWLRRWLFNLCQIFERNHCHHDASAMKELAALLDQADS